jgi:hypothetical protein
VAKRTLVGKMLIVCASSLRAFSLTDDAIRRSSAHHPSTRCPQGLMEFAQEHLAGACLARGTLAYD